MKRSIAILALVLLVLSFPAVGFVASGHKLATELALTAAAKEMPAFFFQGRRTIIQAAADPDDQRIQAFAHERLSACATFTGSLYLTAWADSAKVKLPTWLVRARAEVSGPPASQPAPAAKD